ncbi:MAG: hypothetical protein JW861_01370, partial [Bacteroidales bacterium]|nr:hypothetical protein [Bacteroidales bacterium]
MKPLFCLFIVFISLSARSQYLENPSFEGEPAPNFPPPGWVICGIYSTPDILPGVWGVYLPPSDGVTYLGMTARPDYTNEDVQAHLITPLSMDSCYRIRIDLAYQQWVNSTNMSPVILKIYGSNLYCNKSNLIWESNPVSNTEWETQEFLIKPDPYDYEYLLLETSWVSTPPYWGYVLMDNIRIETTPHVDLGNDTTIISCGNDSLVLNAGSGFAAYLWQDGSTDSTFVVYSTGLYWVQVSNEIGCTDTDSIYVTFDEYVEMISELPDTAAICEGEVLEITVNVSNGRPPYSYLWDETSDTTASIIVSPDTLTTYHVGITDGCGNTIYDSITVVVMPPPDIWLGNDTTICHGETLMLHAGPGHLGYSWQDGSQDSTYLVTQPGLYWCEILSTNYCTARDSINVNMYPPINLDIGNG